MARIARRLGRHRRRRGRWEDAGKVLRKLARLRGSFDEGAFAVYENNSTDRTKAALRRLAVTVTL
jgi:hypothetical protein